ncbi:MAG: P1 family peptidase [Armatimonadota bacterium]|nr:P1 family peptidase [Armatimonadota bacterium]
MPSLTDIQGLRVGHATDAVGLTGCTVVLCDGGATASGEVRGAAPGTRETDLLHPSGLVQQVHAVLLTGGSAFGLAAADGVMRYLEERGIGFDAGVARVPIVPAAVVFDLAIRHPRARPDAAMGYAACAAATAGPVEEGSVGAGTGATVGKVLGLAGATKGGVGSWCVRLADGPAVGALAVVNAFGDVTDERTGEVLAGARGPDGRFVRTGDVLLARPPAVALGTNTTLVVVATDAPLTKAQAWRLAVQGHAGLSRAIAPSHTLYDGDVVFALATGTWPGAPLQTADLLRLGEAAAGATAEAVRRGVRAARGLGGIPGLADLTGGTPWRGMRML